MDFQCFLRFAFLFGGVDTHDYDVVKLVGSWV